MWDALYRNTHIKASNQHLPNTHTQQLMSANGNGFWKKWDDIQEKVVVFSLLIDLIIINSSVFCLTEIKMMKETPPPPPHYHFSLSCVECSYFNDIIKISPTLLFFLLQNGNWYGFFCYFIIVSVDCGMRYGQHIFFESLIGLSGVRLWYGNNM